MRICFGVILFVLFLSPAIAAGENRMSSHQALRAMAAGCDNGDIRYCDELLKLRGLTSKFRDLIHRQRGIARFCAGRSDRNPRVSGGLRGILERVRTIDQRPSPKAIAISSFRAIAASVLLI